MKVGGSVFKGDNMLFQRKKLAVVSIFSVLILLIFGGLAYYDHQKHYIETIWHENVECDDNILYVINSPILQRLKYIDQSGPARYLGPKLPAFSRYEHSIGVFALLKKFNVPFKEQVAGLFHDASHTVFSHVGDYIWAENINDYAESSYQDSIHANYLKKQNCEKILSKISLELKDIDLDHNKYLALDQKLPDMCADRIQYNIHTGVLTGKISKDDANNIVKSLDFKDGKWYFKDKESALKFAELSLYFTQNFWGAKWNTSMNIHFANALKRALSLKILTSDDMFSTDKKIMNKLTKNQDHIIQLNLQQCKEPLAPIKGCKYTKQHFTPKFRGVDPLVMQDQKLVRLSSIDMIFKSHYDEVKSWCQAGFEIDILRE